MVSVSIYREVRDKFGAPLGWDENVKWDKLISLMPTTTTFEVPDEKYTSSVRWAKIYAGDKQLYRELIEDITFPLTTSFYEVDWYFRREVLIKRAVAVMYLRPQEEIEYLIMYLNIFFHGSRYILGDPQGDEIKPIKYILFKYPLRFALEKFHLLDDIYVVDDMTDWVSTNIDAYENLNGLMLLVKNMNYSGLQPVQFDPERSIDGERCTNSVNQDKDMKLNQLFTVLLNFSDIYV